MAPEQMVLTCLGAGRWSASERQKKAELGKPSPLRPSQRQARIFQRLCSEPGVSISIPGSQAEDKGSLMALSVCVCNMGCLAQLGSSRGMDFRGGKMGLGEAKPPPGLEVGGRAQGGKQKGLHGGQTWQVNWLTF